jgi:chemotaxis protein MotB
LSSKNQATEEISPKVPGYIVTFSDMVTLLLTFFVMLLTLAEVQDPALFNKGRDSFVKSIRYVGLGVLFGIKEMPDFSMGKIKYYTPDPDQTFARRSIDANREKSRRIFKKLTQSMSAIPSQIAAENTNFILTNIRFSPGSAALNEPAKRFLTEFCLDLKKGLGSEAVKLYVLGLDSDEATEKEQWILSARRAQATAVFLEDTLASLSDWPVYSWGAGPGGNWVGQNSPISKKSHILIAVLRAGD